MRLSSWSRRVGLVQGSPRLAGRAAGVLYIGAGILSLLSLALPSPPDMDRMAVGGIACLAIVVGVFAWCAPWDRWPRRSSLLLVPVAFALIALGNTFSGYQPYGYSIYYVVVFVWLGITYPSGTSLWFAPLALVAYVLPMVALPGEFAVDVASVAIVLPTCVLIGELLAWERGRLQRAEASLLETSERARGLADAAFEAIVLHDGVQIVEANRAFVGMFGYPSEEVPGLPLSAVGLDVVAAVSASGSDRAGRPDEALSLSLRRRDASMFSAEVGVRSLPPSAGHLQVAAIRDVTDYRRAIEREQSAAERLRALDEMKNTFLNAVSHELRTPLAVVLGSALTLEQLGLDIAADDRHALVEGIAKNARKLERMLADLLDVDRLTRGVVELRRQPADIDALIRGAVEGVDVAGREVDVQVAPMTFAVDAPKVERIVENLVTNAARHTPDGCPVWVRARPVAGGLVIVVEDAGPGVPAPMRTQIFEPFRQGRASDDDAPNAGLGIGLSLVARFAELHGGRAWVEDREGGGASFHVLLGHAPASSALPEPADARIA
jgi:signal transduction histidine kinase